MKANQLELTLHYVPALTRLVDTKTGASIPMSKWEVIGDIENNESVLTIEIPMYFVDVKEVKQHEGDQNA